MNKRIIILFLSISIINVSCVVNKHYYETYETDIPSTYNFKKISKERYNDYFVEDVYCRLETLATNYYPNKKRESAPFEIRILCKSKTLDYDNISFRNIKIISNLENEYFPQNDINLVLQEITDKKGNSYLISRYKQDQMLDSFNFKHSENEILTVVMDAFLYDKKGNCYSKSLKYVLYPKTRVEYFNLLSDLF